MISLKRNKKTGEFEHAKGLRQSRWIYSSDYEQFKISRGKVDDFISCPRCFYLDRVIGLKTPSLPGWSLNVAVDELLKKEFDDFRKREVAHPDLVSNGYEHIIPLKNEHLASYRDSLHGGVQYKIPNTNIILTGGVDDIWYNINNKKVVVTDYKAQANEKDITPESYLSSIYHQGYKKQLDFYAYLLDKNGFNVDQTGFFYVANARVNREKFEGTLHFDIHVIPYEIDTSWVDETLDKMVACLNQKSLPKPTEHCENCAFNDELLKQINLHDTCLSLEDDSI